MACRGDVLQFTRCCHVLLFISSSQPSYQTGAEHPTPLGLILLLLPDVRGPPAHSDLYSAWLPAASPRLLRDHDKNSSAVHLSWTLAEPELHFTPESCSFLVLGCSAKILWSEFYINSKDHFDQSFILIPKWELLAIDRIFDFFCCCCYYTWYCF